MKKYVCVLSTDNYLDGVLAVHEMLEKLESKYDLICLINDSISYKSREILDLFHIEYKLMNNIKYDHSNSIDTRFKYTFDKLNVFALTEYEKIVYLDSDFLIKTNLDFLFDIDKFTMVSDEPYHDKDYYNSALMVINPNIDDYNSLVLLAQEKNKLGCHISDQDVINEYFKEINVLDKTYNNMRLISPNVKNVYDPLHDKFVKKLSCIKTIDNYENKIIHYIGKLKPFLITDEYDDEEYFVYLNYLRIVRNKKIEYEKNKSKLSIVILNCDKIDNLSMIYDILRKQNISNYELILHNCDSDCKCFDDVLNYKFKCDSNNVNDVMFNSLHYCNFDNVMFIDKNFTFKNDNVLRNTLFQLNLYKFDWIQFNASNYSLKLDSFCQLVDRDIALFSKYGFIDNAIDNKIFNKNYLINNLTSNYHVYDNIKNVGLINEITMEMK